MNQIEIEKINHEASENIKFAWDIGFDMPKVKFFKSIPYDEIEKYKGWITLDEFIIMEDVGGIPLTFYQFWNGEKWSLKTCAIRDRHLLSGGMGPVAEENMITMFSCDNTIIKRFLARIKKRLDEYVGFVTVNVKIVNGRVFYSWIKFGSSDQMGNCLRLLCNEPNLEEVQEVPRGFSCCLLTYSFPDVPVDYSYGRGKSIRECWEVALSDIPKSLCYRNDGSWTSRKTFKEIIEKKII